MYISSIINVFDCGSLSSLVKEKVRLILWPNTEIVALFNCDEVYIKRVYEWNYSNLTR